MSPATTFLLLLCAIAAAALPFVLRRRRLLVQRQQAETDRQTVVLDAMDRLARLIKSDRPAAEIEGEARALIATIRSRDVDASLVPIAAHFEAELARRRDGDAGRRHGAGHA